MATEQFIFKPQRRQVVRREAHNLPIAGSIPAAATTQLFLLTGFPAAFKLLSFAEHGDATLKTLT